MSFLFSIAPKCKAVFPYSFFDNDPPVVDEHGKHAYGWKTVLKDDTGAINVEVRDDACRNMFEMCPLEFQRLWESCQKDVDKQKTILADLNSKLAGNFMCHCSCVVWRYGAHREKAVVQYYANGIDVAAEYQ